MKTYIASPFFNETQLSQVISIEQLLTNLSDDYYSPRLHGNFSELKLSDKLNNIAKSLIFEDNINQIKISDRVIVNLDGNRDIGTLFELGVAIGLNKKIHLLLDKDTDVLDEYRGIPTGSAAYNIEYTVLSNTSINYIINYLNSLDKSNANRIKEVVVNTLAKDSFPAGIILLGFHYILNCKVSYISDYVSRSNLMISQSGIKQYKSEEDYHNGKFVDYNSMKIQ